MANSKIVAGIVFSLMFAFSAVVVEAAGPKLKLSRKTTTSKAKTAPQEPAVLKQAPAATPIQPQGAVPSNPRLFYNYYSPTQGGGIPSAIYPAPKQVPLIIGHTYNTYQPLMPHELMYRHNRSYHNYYPNGAGFTRTFIRYR